mgnify:CR=1 FL=1
MAARAIGKRKPSALFGGGVGPLNRLAEIAAKEIRDAILTGAFKLGENISEDRLVAQMGISRTPIRDAMAILSREGLVNVRPKRGSFVFETSLEDLAAICDYRQMLDECRPDVVHVVTMPGHLLPIVSDCLERGLHTSVEKAPGMSAAQTAQMAQAASNSAAKSRADTASSEFAQGRSKPSAAAVSSRSSGNDVPASAAAPSGHSLSRRRASRRRPVSRSNITTSARQ